METEPQLDTSRPSNLRLAGFAATASGALLLGIGSRLLWVTVGFGDVPGSESTYRGAELGAGKVALGSAILILIAVLAARAVSARWRAWFAVAIIVVAAIPTVLAAWFVVSAADHYSPINDDKLVDALAAIEKRTPEEVRAALSKVLDTLGGYTHIGTGPWLVILGGALAIVGGVLTLRWARAVGSPEPTSEA